MAVSSRLRDGKGALTETVLFSVPSAGGRSEWSSSMCRRMAGGLGLIVKNVVMGSFAYSALIQLDGGRVGLFFEEDHYRTISLIELEVEKLLDE